MLLHNFIVCFFKIESSVEGLGNVGNFGLATRRIYKVTLYTRVAYILSNHLHATQMIASNLQWYRTSISLVELRNERIVFNNTYH